MKKSSFSLCFIFVMLLFMSQPVLAQRGGIYIGKVDLYTVAMLHPAMIWFSPEKNAFKVNRDEISKKKVSKTNKTNEEERSKLESKVKTLKSRINEENRRYNQKIEGLTKKFVDKIDKVGTATAALNRERQQIEMAKASVEHKSKLTSFYGEISLCQDKLYNLDHEFDVNYTTSEETDRKFIEIINEIKSYAKRIADQKGISIVLNTGYKKFLPKNIKRPNLGEVESNAFGNIFSNQFPSELVKDEAAVRGYYLGIESVTENWLEMGGNFLGNSMKNFVEEDVLIGGVDLTPDILAALYKAYKLDPNISNAIIQIIKKQ